MSSGLVALIFLGALLLEKWIIFFIEENTDNVKKHIFKKKT